MIKKSAYLCLFLVLILNSCSSGNQNRLNPGPVTVEPVETANTGNGIFHDASYIAKDMKLGFNLGNTMEAYDATDCTSASYTWIPYLGSSISNYEKYWGAPVTTQEIIDGIKSAGFSTVRIPVFWGNRMENDGNWDINPQLLNRVREIVDYCFNADLYVVINIHHFDEFIIRRNNLENCKLIFSKLWTEIATYFSNYSEKLIFEGFNEYLGGQQFKNGTLQDTPEDEAYIMANALNKTFVDAVRASGGNNKERVLIISGYWTNIDLTSAKKFNVPADVIKNRLMVSVHYVDNTMFWVKKIGSTEWLNYIDNQCEKLKAAFTENGIPVFMGETTSVYPKSNFAQDVLPEYNTSASCLEYVLNRLLDYNFVPVLWDTEQPGNFYSRANKKINDAENQEVIFKLAQALKN